MKRDKGWRLFQRHTKAMRRINEDRQQHKPTGQQTLEETCSCFTQPGTPEFGRTFARFADHPKNCNGLCCANPRRVFGEITYQEKREAQDWLDEY